MIPRMRPSVLATAVRSHPRGASGPHGVAFETGRSGSIQLRRRSPRGANDTEVTPMRLGEVANAEAARYGKPLDGVRVLSVEQMQALPWGTQLLARLGADVVKIEHPTKGDLGRSSVPAMTDPAGRRVGATFLRNNLNKRSVSIDLKHPEGRDLVLALAPKFDVFAENSKAGALARLGLGYDDVAAVHPSCIYVSTSGFGNTVTTPYADWPAYAAV